MKRIRLCLFASFIFCSLTVSSQIFIGGNIRINISDNSSSGIDYSLRDISISPDIGKYLSEKLAVGTSFNLYHKRNKSGEVDEQMLSSVGISPFLRYYFLQLNKFSLFGQGNLGLEYQKVKEFQQPDERNRIRTYVSFYPGISYDLNDHFLLQTTLHFMNFEYEYVTTIDGSPKQKTSELYFSSGLDGILSMFNLNIGAVYKF